jgi:hypothetical protein
MTIPHAILEVELRVEVPIPVLLIEEVMEADPENLSDTQMRELLEAEPYRLHDAIDSYLDSMPDLEAEYARIENVEPPEQLKTVRADGVYKAPAPSLLERYNYSTGTLSTESPANVLTDEQARGALWALRHAWNLPGMNRHQREYMVLFMSELEWVCCSRPSLHFFKPTEDSSCEYCGMDEPGHDVRNND